MPSENSYSARIGQWVEEEKSDFPTHPTGLSSLFLHGHFNLKCERRAESALSVELTPGNLPTLLRGWRSRLIQYLHETIGGSVKSSCRVSRTLGKVVSAVVVPLGHEHGA